MGDFVKSGIKWDKIRLNLAIYENIWEKMGLILRQMWHYM